MELISYLNFNGTCEEAFQTYKQVLGGEIVALYRFGEMPGEPDPSMAGCANLIMHARLVNGDAVLMGSDCPPGMYNKPGGVSVSIMVDTIEEAERIYAELSPGGEAIMPIQETFWAQRFAMFTDRWGIPWMINCERGAEGG